jgi:hypothetical protein
MRLIRAEQRGELTVIHFLAILFFSFVILLAPAAVRMAILEA